MSGRAGTAVSVVEVELPEADAWSGLVEAFGPVVVVDLETTGLDAHAAEVIEVGAIRLEPGAPASVFASLVKPGGSVPEAVRLLTGLDDVALCDAPPWRDVESKLSSFVAECSVIAHNANFERSFLSGVVSSGARWLDTLELACVLRPELEHHDLRTLVTELLGPRPGHRALRDARDTLLVLLRLVAEIAGGEHDQLLDVLAVPERRWAWRALFADRLRADLGPLGRVRGRRPAGSGEGEARGLGSLDLSWTAAVDRITALLRDESQLRQEIPGYRVREGQVELTEKILDAFRDERALAVEAGTGIGKTLAYTLGAFCQAAIRDERVVISSANRTLQERVVAEELPAIARALGVPPIPALVLKGRANYGNPARAREIALAEDDAGEPGLSTRARLFLVSYFTRCPHRDLDSFGGWLAAQEPALRQVRERIACSGDCDPRLCRREESGACGYLARVDALPDARVVSINHALLLAWPERYGVIDHLIIDEAHELVGEGDRAFAEVAEARALRQALALVQTDPRKGLVGALAARAGRRDLLEPIEDRVDRVSRGLDLVGTKLSAVAGEQQTAVPEGSLLPQQGPWSELAGSIQVLVEELSALADLLEQVAPPDPGVPEEREAPGQDALHREVGTLARQFRSVAAGVLADLFAQSREAHVYAAQAIRRRDEGYDWRITVTPLDAAELIYARALEFPRTVLALSATLGVGGDPAPTLEKLGWGGIPRAQRMDSLVLPSPFDFPNRAVLGLARGRTYRDAGFEEDCARAVADVARLLGGRTLVLFTSRRRLYGVARRLREEFRPGEMQLLVQPATGGAGGLVETFLSSSRSILLGTRSLWQGIDIPGAALSCVLIDKFPFPLPNDPLFRGREHRLRSMGGDPFRTLSLEPAVVLFKQMFGRLVRNETDRGFVVVLGADPDKSYVDDFVRSLPGPPALITAEMPEILVAMQEFFGINPGESGDSSRVG